MQHDVCISAHPHTNYSSRLLRADTSADWSQTGCGYPKRNNCACLKDRVYRTRKHRPVISPNTETFLQSPLHFNTHAQNVTDSRCPTKSRQFFLLVDSSLTQQQVPRRFGPSHVTPHTPPMEHNKTHAVSLQILHKALYPVLYYRNIDRNETRNMLFIIPFEKHAAACHGNKRTCRHSFLEQRFLLFHSPECP